MDRSVRRRWSGALAVVTLLLAAVGVAGPPAVRASLPVAEPHLVDPWGTYGPCHPEATMIRTRAIHVLEIRESLANVPPDGIEVLDCHPFDGPGGSNRVDPDPLGSSHQQQCAAGGFTYCILNFNDGAGNHIFLGVNEVDNGCPAAPAVPGNLLDSDTSTLEGSIGHWVPWFSSTASRSTAEAHTGCASLRAEITAPHGWGVQLDNWPGFPAAPGPKYLSFWARQAVGSGLGATMHVDWRGADGSVFRTDQVVLPALSTTWQQRTRGVIAPPGTVSVTVEVTSPSGEPGDVVYLDDLVVADTTNLVEYTTSTLESSTGHWVPWFSSAVSHAGPPVNGGNFSLRVDVTAPHGWGIQFDNWPGFPATPGPKTFAFWVRLGTGSGPLGATMRVRWWDAGGTHLAFHAGTFPALDPFTGQHGSVDVTAPPGTAWVTVEIFHASGGPGDHLYIDDILVADRPI